MFSSLNTGICARLVVVAGTMTGSSIVAAEAAAAPADVRISVSIGGHSHHAARPIVQPERQRNYAGTLTIDGHIFRITTCEPVQHQIRDAFEHMGYRASCTGRAVRVSTARGGPEVCWRNGDYTLEFRERRGNITVTPIHDCHDDDYGRHYRYCFDRAHGRYYTYHEVDHHTHAHHGEQPPTWTAIGASVFIEDDDHDHHSHTITGRTDDRNIAQTRYQPNDRRVSTALPHARNEFAEPNIELRRRSVSPARQPGAPQNMKYPEPKRSTAAKQPVPVERPTILPADRFGGLKPGVKPDAPRVDDAKTRSNAPAAKPSDNKRAKW